jgi:RimJ/RimL family protein N-acetyltransferase
MFENLDLNKIYLKVIDFNKKTISFHKNFGFSIDGIFRDDILKNNQYCNLVHMSLLKKEWVNKKNSIDSFLKKINNFEISYQGK